MSFYEKVGWESFATNQKESCSDSQRFTKKSQFALYFSFFACPFDFYTLVPASLNYPYFSKFMSFPFVPNLVRCFVLVQPKITGNLVKRNKSLFHLVVLFQRNVLSLSNGNFFHWTRTIYFYQSEVGVHFNQSSPCLWLGNWSRAKMARNNEHSLH